MWDKNAIGNYVAVLRGTVKIKCVDNVGNVVFINVGFEDLKTRN